LLNNLGGPNETISNTDWALFGAASEHEATDEAIPNGVEVGPD